MERSTEPAGRLFTSIVSPAASDSAAVVSASAAVSYSAAAAVVSAAAAAVVSAVSEEPQPESAGTAIAAAITIAINLFFFIHSLLLSL